MKRFGIQLMGLILFAGALGAQGQTEEAVPVAESASPQTAAAAGRPSLSLKPLTVNDGTAGLLDLNASTSGYTTTGVFMQALTSGSPHITAKLGTATSASNFSIFNSANTNLFYIDGAGKVGIGTTAPAAELHIVTGSAAMPRGLVVEQVSAGGGGRMIMRKARGTPGAPTAVVQNDAIGNLHMQTFDGSTWIDPASIRFFVDGPVSVGHVPAGIEFRTSDGPAGGGGSGFPRMTITSAGLVGIGTSNITTLLTIGNVGGTGTKLTVNGDVVVSGNLGAKYQDVAEWVSAGSELEAATVVVLDPSHEDQVIRSSRSYDASVAGVVSAQPGVILGIASDSKEMIATTGRVKVRVDATRRPIAIGDLLVTSDVPGMAMKSEPIEINGRAFHQPGTIIGKALQPLAGGQGEILVLLSLQ